MDEAEAPNDELVIQIPKALWNNEKKKQGQKFRGAQHSIFDSVGVQDIFGYRGTPHGPSYSQSLLIPKTEQRAAVLTLFRNQALYTVLPKILNHIYDLGIDEDAEKRHFAALAIAELSKFLSFLEMTDQCINPWIRSDRFSYGKQTAALTLVTILQHGIHDKDVFQILRYWSSNSNPRLMATALIVCHHIYDTYPNETLAAIEQIVLSRNAPLANHAGLIIDVLYAENPMLVLEQLFKWFSSDVHTDLRKFSAKKFFDLASLDDITDEGSTWIDLTDYIYTLWELGIGKEKPAWQQRTTQKLKSWAITMLTEKETSEEKANYRKFFMALDKKYGDLEENRLRLRLKRWQTQADEKDRRLPEHERLHLNFIAIIDPS